MQKWRWKWNDQNLPSWVLNFTHAHTQIARVCIIQPHWPQFLAIQPTAVRQEALTMTLFVSACASFPVVTLDSFSTTKVQSQSLENSSVTNII